MGVHGDHVQLRRNAAQQRSQPAGVLGRVVDALDQGVLEEDRAPRRDQIVVAQRTHELRKREAPVEGDELVTNLVADIPWPRRRARNPSRE